MEKTQKILAQNLNRRLTAIKFNKKRNLIRRELQQKARTLQNMANIRFSSNFNDRINVSNLLLKRNIKKYRRSINLKNKTILRKLNNASLPINQIQNESFISDGITNFISHRVTTNGNNILDLFHSIQKFQDDQGKDGFVTLFYKDSRNEQIIPRKITITENSLDTFNEFRNRIEDIQRGKVQGSDRFHENQYELIVNKFDFITIDIQADGQNDNILFNCENNNGDKKSSCIYKVAQKIGLKNINKKCNDVEYMLDQIREQNLNVKIYNNSLRLKINPRKLRLKRKNIIYKTKKRIFKLINLVDDDIETVLIYCPEYEYAHNGKKSKFNLIYSEKDKHIEILKGEPTLNKIYMSACKKIFRQTKKGFTFIMTPTAIFKTNSSKSVGKLVTIFFDYETITNWFYSGVMTEYALSIFVADYNCLNLLDFIEKMKKGPKKDKMRDEIIKENCVNWKGFDCTTKFIEYIKANQKNICFKLVSFNGANFDNLILYRRICYLFPDIVRNPMFNGNQLLDFQLFGRHSMFDMRKHLTGSLKQNCKDFGIKSFAKKEISHHHAQKLFDNKKLIVELSKKWGEKLEKYNNYDVLSLGLLYYRYAEALKQIPVLKEYGENLYKWRTIGGIIFNVFEKYVKKNNINLPKLSLKQYKDLQKYKVAGRVEMFHGRCRINKRICSIDVCSLYPFICAILNIYFPCGQIKELKNKKAVEEFLIMNKKLSKSKSKIYFLYCDVDQSNLKDLNLPNIYPEKTKISNNWKSTNKLEDYLLSSPIIELLEQNKCEVIKKSGFYFTKKVKNYKIFGFLHDLMKEKNKQDDYKKGKNKLYNNALRQAVKLLSNAISGKVIEGLHCNKIVQVNTYKFLKIKNNKNTVKISAINIIGTKVFCSYTATAKSLLKRQRAIYLGVLIYDYAKIYMYNFCYSKVGLQSLLYTDTDAGKMDINAFNKWVKEYGSKIIVPHWKYIETIDKRYITHTLYNPNSKVYGSFEEELSETNTGGIFTNKKCWWVKNGAGSGKNKYGFKGLGKNDLLLNNLNLDFINKKTIQHRNGETEDKYSISDSKKAYYFYNNNSNMTFENNNEKLFNDLYDNHFVYVLCQSFRKQIRNTKMNTNLDEHERFNKINNSICCVYTIKKLTSK